MNHARMAARFVRPFALLLCGIVPALVGLGLAGRAQELDKRVVDAEDRRVAAIDKVKPSVVAVFAHGGQGGGSGVLISKDGYALTNFHVVEGSGPIMQCGLADGVLYDAVLVGLDKVGDVSLIKLLPKAEKQEFKFAVMGDSDKVRTGDWSLAMGNPFLLATDFNPTVTYGLVSGIHRYQYPAGTLLEYTDCIQVDTSINPGNSGGPLFNLDGELIGINGRASFDKRARINSGVGYAISINQIKNFLGHLRAGIDTDHATLGAMVASTKDEDDSSAERITISDIIETSDAHRRGLEENDELVSFAGRPITSVNQFKNVLGLFPKGWRVPLTYRRGNEKHEILVRLMQLQRRQTPDEKPETKRIDSADADQVQQPPKEGGKPKPSPILPHATPPANPAVAKFYDPKPGFANFYFNKSERDRLLSTFREHGDFAGVAGDWTIQGEALVKNKKYDAKFAVTGGAKPMLHLTLGSLDYELDPLQVGQAVAKLKDPPGSGGLLMALYQYRRLLTRGAAGFEQYANHGGHEPFYPYPVDGTLPRSLKELRVDTEVLLTEHAAAPARWYFSLDDQSLLGFEVTVQEDEDPCEIYLSDYRKVDGRQLPHRFEVRNGDQQFAIFTVKSYQLATK